MERFVLIAPIWAITGTRPFTSSVTTSSARLRSSGDIMKASPVLPVT